MPGRNERAAWREFREPIARAVGCVDLQARLVERQFDGGIHLLASSPEAIRFGPALLLHFSLRLEAEEAGGVWRMSTRRYDLTITPRNNVRETVFSWHWHPASRRSRITYPHVHVPSASAFRTKHIPSGRVALEDVILFGFEDLDVEPARPDARAVVEAVRDRHKEFRSWH